VNKKGFLPFGLLFVATILSAYSLSSGSSFADEEQADTTVTVSAACTMFRDSTVPHVTSGAPSSYHENVGTTRLKTVCNDKDGYAIYAIGYSNDTDGDTNMYGEESGETIPTGTVSGDVSNWSMKLMKDNESYNPENLTITPAFTSYTNIPSTQTKVASFSGATDTVKGSVVETTYAIRVSSTQLADTYVGQVKYTMVHPADGTAPEGPEPIVTYIQNINKDTCPTTPTTVVDSRDGEEYTIQKLADGNCWLLDNLRLDITNVSLANLEGKTNASNETLGYLKNGGGTTSDPYAINGAIEWTTGQNYSSPLVYTSGKDLTGTGGYEAGKYGVYYNYCAATAGSYCYGNSSGSSGNGDGENGNPSSDASEDICPKGWRLPTGGSSGEYGALNDALDGYFNVLVGLRTPLSGVLSSGSIVNNNSYGQFWSSEKNNNYNMYVFNVNRTSIGHTFINRNYGASVRCIAKEAPEPEPEKLDIQDITPETCPANPTIVVDSRDGEEYTIQKLADGNCWMLENLRLDADTLEVTLSPENTNMDPNTPFTLPQTNTDDDYWFDNGRLLALVDTVEKDTELSYGSGSSKAGVLYNYCAATAGTICTEDDSGDALYDICPKGWRMPTGGAGEIGQLYNSYNSLGDFKEAFRVVLPGVRYWHEIDKVNDAAYYWTSTMFILSSAPEIGYIRYFTKVKTNEITYEPDGVQDGMSIRCIAKEPEPLYMQDVSEWKDSLEINESIKVVDRRDGKEYWVTKLKTDSSIPDDRANCTGEDNNRVCTQIWMTQNLDFDLDNTKTYTHSDTDLGWTNGDESVVLTPQVSTATTTSDSFNSGYDPGNRYFYNSGTTEDDIEYQSLGECVDAGHTQDECTHYHYGNVYPFGAAIASGATTNGGPIAVEAEDYKTAPNSICPAGWRLPEGPSSVNGHSDFDYLFYGNDISLGLAGVNKNPGYTTNGFNMIRTEPFWFTRVNSVISNGSTSMLWTGTFSQSQNSYVMLFGPYYVVPSTNSNSYIPVRCIAREGYNGGGSSSITPTPDPEYIPEIQDITPATCPTEPTVVRDSRDDSTYTIQKLADGKCWMLDNLRLGRSTAKILTPDDTNIRSNFTLPGNVSVGFNEYELPQINIDSRNDTTSYGSGENKIGVYYNFCAASAGTYCPAQGSSSGTPAEDICPKGWRLPTGGDNGEYQNLYNQYNTYADFKNALRASLSGYFKYDKNNHQGSYGSFWSSSPVGDDRMYSLDVRATSVPDDFTSYRTAGISIRCVAYDAPQTYIQDITPDSCPTTPTVVYDRRDNAAYTIQKLADGTCWMLDNLRLGRSTVKVLTPEDTNITKNFTLPGSISTGFNSYIYPQINIDSKNKITSYGDGDNKIGVYYNYCAATAGTYCMPRYEAAGSPTEDICPRGWRMPTGGEEGEYQNLFSQYSTYADFKNALHASLSGYFKYAQNNHQGSYGSFWSTTPVGDDRMYSLDVRESSVPNDFTSYRTAGISIRCVAKKTYIQDVTYDTCSTSPMVVYDKRDEEKYTIQKLADGECWLLDNLRLNLVDVSLDILKGETNASDISLEYLKGSRTGTTIDRYATGSVNDNWDSTSYSVPKISTKDIDTIPENAFPGKVGIHYNFCAASAGSYCYGNNNNNGTAVGNASEDICPAGWKIPTGGENGEYQALSAAYNDDFSSVVDALRLPFSGYYYSFTYSENPDINTTLGVVGWFWSSVRQSNWSMYALFVRDDPVLRPREYNNRNTGVSVRCIAKRSKRPSVFYMQEVDSWKQYLGINESVEAIDTRDGKKYWVTKLQTSPELADSRADCEGSGSNRICTQIWMTQNLDLELTANTVQYDHSNTDLGYTNNDLNVVWTPKVATVNSTSSLSNSTTAERSYNYGDYYIYTSGGTSNDYVYSSLSACKSAGHSEGDCKHYHAGNLYNYYAAAARGATSDGNTIPMSSNQYTNAPNSICPAGWRLPVGATPSGYSDFDYVLYQNGVTVNHVTSGDAGFKSGGSVKMRSSPFYFVRPGYTFGTTLDSYRLSGLLWSSTIYSSTQSYNANYRHDFVYPQARSDSYCGFSVRCIAR